MDEDDGQEEINDADWGLSGLTIVGGSAKPWERGADRLIPGARLGDRFLLGARLGEGAGSVVFRARDLQSGREVALKVLRAAHLDDEGRARFRREAQLSGTLEHPAAIRAESAGEIEDLPFIAYELVAGARTLGEAMAELSQRERLRAVRAVAEALGEAHAKGIVHRDVKPRNILVDAEGRARLIDFGLAAAKGVERLTRTQALVGTATHMAPEQIRSQRDRVGPGTDVWGLGVVLYECLTGRLPFAERTLPEQREAVCGVDPEPPGASPRLDEICLRCLEKEPERRFVSGSEVAAALAEALLGDRPGS